MRGVVLATCGTFLALAGFLLDVTRVQTAVGLAFIVAGIALAALSLTLREASK